MSNMSTTYTPADLDQLNDDDRRILTTQINQKFKTTTTRYIKELMGKSDAIRKQFQPTFYEGLDFGRERPFEAGKHNSGIYGLERIYEDRAVLTPFFGCASYCRYCFKKVRTLGGGSERMSDENIADAVAYIRNDPRINTALITGGDPLALPQLTVQLVGQLAEIPHITKIRIGTRHILFQPNKITADLVSQIAEYKHVDPFDPMKSTQIAIGVSLNHPDELQPEVITAIQHFVRSGIAVRGQSVLMKNINDNPQTMKKLLEYMLLVGITPYYLLHCMDVTGSYHMRTSVQKGLDILAELAEFSGTYAPLYVYVTPVGKHRISPGHKLNYVEIDGRQYIKTVSPYKADRFLEFSDNAELPPLHYANKDGYIVSHYLDGDDVSLDY